MADVLKAAFIFLGPKADPGTHRQWVKTDKIEVLSVAVKDYASAVALAPKLVDEEKIAAIELCGGFGNKGTAMIVDAVKGRVPVGVVRFDIHPGLGSQSGDALF